MVVNIDYDRGVMMNVHPSNVEVYMYLDDPGVYLSAHGTPVTEDFARGAGFDVVEQTKKRQVKERMKVAMTRINAELELAASEKVVVMERNGFKLVDLGLDRHQVESPDGLVLNKDPLPLAQAKTLLEALTPEKKSEKMVPNKNTLPIGTGGVPAVVKPA